MPFKSKKQEKWAFANKKPFAKEWAKKTDQKKIPEESGEMGEMMGKGKGSDKLTHIMIAIGGKK